MELDDLPARSILIVLIIHLMLVICYCSLQEEYCGVYVNRRILYVLNSVESIEQIES